MDMAVISTLDWLPFSAEDLRKNLRRSTAVEDALLADFILAATRYVEQRTKRSLRGRTLAIYAPQLPREYIELPAPPLRFAADADPETAVTVRYKASGGVWTAMPAGAYGLRCCNGVWRLERGTEPLPVTQAASRVLEIRIDVGFASAAEFRAAEPALYDAIMLLASHRDANREATIIEPRVITMNRKIEFGVDALLASRIIPTRYSPMWA